MGACGDVTRNIIGCPLAGIDRDEICDASPLVYQATRMLVGNPDFYNLPRKHKVTISGCSVWCLGSAVFIEFRTMFANLPAAFL